MTAIFFTVLCIVAVIVAVAMTWVQILRVRWDLQDLAELLEGAIHQTKPDSEDIRELIRRTRASLKASGMDRLSNHARDLVLDVTVARAQALRAKVASRIELMTQSGLLGTVLGLSLSLAVDPESVFAGLGLALITTLIGLSGAAAAKVRLEPEVDGLVEMIVVLSNNARLRTLFAPSSLPIPQAEASNNLAKVRSSAGPVAADSTTVVAASREPANEANDGKA